MSSNPAGEPVSAHAQRMNELGEQIDRIVAVEQQISRLHAVRAQLIEGARGMSMADAEANVAESASHPRGPAGGWTARNISRRELVTELACALRVPTGSAERLIEESRALMCDLPGTRLALRAGEFSYRHAVKLMEHARSLPEESLPAFEHAVLPFARTLTAARFDQKARIERELSHPQTIEKRVLAARTERAVVVEQGRDGMAWLMCYVPAEIAIAGHNRITDIASSLQGPDESRTLAQLRADVLTDLLIDGATDAIDETEPELIGLSDHNLEVVRSMQHLMREQAGELHSLESVATVTANRHGIIDTRSSLGTEPTRRTVGKLSGIDRGVRATVMVTVPALTLLGKSDEPAVLDGYGPIDRDTAMQLASAAPSFARLLTHPETGAVLSVGRESYPVPSDLRRWLAVRDESCRFPGCSRRARRCEIDHSIDWAHGGVTAHDNLAHLCKGDHNLKHHTSWRVQHRARGTLEWTSPTGHTYVTEPAVRMGSVSFKDLGIGSSPHATA